MRMIPCTVLMFTLTLGVLGAEKPETPHLVFVTEYVRQLAAIESIRESADLEFKQAATTNGNENFSIMIHTSTLMQLELGSQIGMLKTMRLKDPFDVLIPNLTAANQQKIALRQRVIDISTAFLSAPEPNVDYGKLVAELSQIKAKLEYIDQGLLSASALICWSLVDMERTDSKNHVNHLVITKAERVQLLKNVTDSFGSKLDAKDMNSVVGAAALVKGFFLKTTSVPTSRGNELTNFGSLPLPYDPDGELRIENRCNCVKDFLCAAEQ